MLHKTPRTRVHRLPARASYDRDACNAILDEALVCHVGFEIDGQPFVIPTTFARIEDLLYVHGAAASRMLRTLAEGVAVCVTVTLLDGLVLARSAFHHSMNYRSVVILGVATEVATGDEKRRALDAIVERVGAGRTREVRPPNEKELTATKVLRLSIQEASVKSRTGGPIDDPEDATIPCWAGHIPLRIVAGEGVPS